MSEIECDGKCARDECVCPVDDDDGEIPYSPLNEIEYKPGDQVRILVGGPHENYLRIATVNSVQENGDVVVYLGDQDEDEWVYSPNELARRS